MERNGSFGTLPHNYDPLIFSQGARQFDGKRMVFLTSCPETIGREYPRRGTSTHAHTQGNSLNSKWFTDLKVNI